MGTFGETIISYPLQHEQQQPSGVSPPQPAATSPTANNYSVTLGGSYPKPHHRSSNAISIRPHPEVLAKKRESGSSSCSCASFFSLFSCISKCTHKGEERSNCKMVL